MHRFLRAIGFSEIGREELDKVLKQIIEYPTVEKAAGDSEGNEFAEISKEFGDFLVFRFGESIKKMILLKWNITILIFVENQFLPENR